MESSTTYNIKFELFKISEADYNEQVRAGQKPKFVKLAAYKEKNYDRDMPLGELLISNYNGTNSVSDVDKLLIEYKDENYLSCSRDYYLVTNKYNGSNGKIKKINESEVWKTPVLLPITNLTGNGFSNSIVSYRSKISEAKPYSSWVIPQNMVNNTSGFNYYWGYGGKGFILIQIYLICVGTTHSSSSMFSGTNNIEDYENDLAEESGIIIGEPQPEPEYESDDTYDGEGYNPAEARRARRVAQIRRQRHNEIADRALRGDIQSYSSRRSNRSRGPFCFRRRIIRGGKSKKHKKSTKKSKKHRKSTKKSKKHRKR